MIGGRYHLNGCHLTRDACDLALLALELLEEVLSCLHGRLLL